GRLGSPALVADGNDVATAGDGVRAAVPDATIGIVTAVETHSYWPNPVGDLREILRALKPGGRLVLVAEAYRSRPSDPDRGGAGGSSNRGTEEGGRMSAEQTRAVLAAYQQVMLASWPNLHPDMAARSVEWPSATEAALQQELQGYLQA